MAEINSIEYRPIDGFPGYRVGNDGSIWSRWGKIQLPSGKGTRTVLGDTWVRLNPSKQKRSIHRAYLYVNLRGNKKLRVHRLVLAAFAGPCPDGMECRHLDGNPNNNNLANLEWGTPLQNALDRKEHRHYTERNRVYTHDGQTLLLKDWARLAGIKYLTLWNRLNTGMPFADAISIKRYDRKAISRTKN